MRNEPKVRGLNNDTSQVSELLGLNYSGQNIVSKTNTKSEREYSN